MAKLTEEQRALYLANRGINCPHCEDSDIEGGPVQIDGGEAYQEITCNSCGEEWTDIYKLVNIQE